MLPTETETSVEVPTSIRINAPTDLIEIVENHRNARGLSLRSLCKGATVSHSAYWYALERGGDIKLSTAIGYLDAVGMRLEVSPKGLD